MPRLNGSAKGAEKAGRTLDIAKNPKHLVRSWLGEPEKVNAMLDNGIHKVNPDGTLTRMGEGMKPILRDYAESNPFKDIKVQEADLDSFLTATRTIEDLQRPKFPGAEENIVTPQQVADANSALTALRAKYGQNYGVLENTAPRIYKFQNDVLDYCVERGLYSPEDVAAIKSRNPHYIPFDRIVEAGERSEIIPKQGGRFSQAGSYIKRIKGSERPIQPVIGSVVKNTYRLIDAADRNAVAASVSELADLFPDQIKIEAAKMRPVAGVTHSAIIDPDFRQAIKNFAEPMGAKFKTGKEVGGGYLGVYDPATKQVLHRQATPESTFAHESGHFFDDKFKLKQRFYKRGESKGIANELIEHMRKMGESPARMAKPEERFARGFEWWLTQRHLAETDLPLFSAEMQKIITDIPELKPLLDIRPSPNKSFETQRTTIFAPDTRPQTPTSIKFKVAGEQQVHVRIAGTLQGDDEHEPRAYGVARQYPRHSETDAPNGSDNYPRLHPPKPHPRPVLRLPANPNQVPPVLGHPKSDGRPHQEGRPI